MSAVEAEGARSPHTSVGLVDALVPATTRWDAAAAPGITALLAALSGSAERRGAALTVWPESAYPYVLPRGTRGGPPGDQRLPPEGTHGPLLVGAVTRDGRGDQYNAALAVGPDGTVSSEYDKLHLVWFGEEVPFATELPWLRRTFARGLGMLPGKGPVRVDAGPVKAGVLICFEDVLPEAGRDAAGVSPNLLVNLSNDAWFSGSAEPELHLRVSVVRAVEARRDLVRAVNLGPTSWVDATGRVRKRYDGEIPVALVVEPALREGSPTPFTRFGDAPFAASGALIAALFWITKRHKRRIT
jgi:apolipoprotein N-acyltransferase